MAVSDTGVGIASDELPHVFHQFYSIAAVNRARPKSACLAICREIVTAHQGRIEVESQPGQGTRFIFTLPKV